MDNHIRNLEYQATSLPNRYNSISRICTTSLARITRSKMGGV